MPSWRDSASQQAQDDLDALLDLSLPFAQQMLDKRGEFLPYGAEVSREGETHLVAGVAERDAPPLSAEVIAVLVARFTHDRDSLRAIAVVADVRTAGSDAVRVELEHREGHAIVILLPYRKKRLGRGIEYAPLTASPGSAQIWPSL